MIDELNLCLTQVQNAIDRTGALSQNSLSQYVNDGVAKGVISQIANLVRSIKNLMRLLPQEVLFSRPLPIKRVE